MKLQLLYHEIHDTANVLFLTTMIPWDEAECIKLVPKTNLKQNKLVLFY